VSFGISGSPPKRCGHWFFSRLFLDSLDTNRKRFGAEWLDKQAHEIPREAK